MMDLRNVFKGVGRSAVQQAIWRISPSLRTSFVVRLKLVVGKVRLQRDHRKALLVRLAVLLQSLVSHVPLQVTPRLQLVVPPLVAQLQVFSAVTIKIVTALEIVTVIVIVIVIAIVHVEVINCVRVRVRVMVSVSVIVRVT